MWVKPGSMSETASLAVGGREKRGGATAEPRPPVLSSLVREAVGCHILLTSSPLRLAGLLTPRRQWWRSCEGRGICLNKGGGEAGGWDKEREVRREFYTFKEVIKLWENESHSCNISQTFETSVSQEGRLVGWLIECRSKVRGFQELCYLRRLSGRSRLQVCPYWFLQGLPFCLHKSCTNSKHHSKTSFIHLVISVVQLIHVRRSSPLNQKLQECVLFCRCRF